MGIIKVEANISKDEERNVYYVCLYYGKTNDGKPNKSYVTASSLKEERRILRDHKKQKEAGLAVPPVKDTLSDYTKDYIDYKSATLEQSTIYGYRNLWKNHIAPFFKKKRIQEITPKDIQDYIAYKVKSGLSKASIKKHIALLYSVFKYGKLEKLGVLS